MRHFINDNGRREKNEILRYHEKSVAVSDSKIRWRNAEICVIIWWMVRNAGNIRVSINASRFMRADAGIN